MQQQNIPISTLVDKCQFGHLLVEQGDLTGSGVNSPLFSLAYPALKASGAKDWYSDFVQSGTPNWHRL